MSQFVVMSECEKCFAEYKYLHESGLCPKCRKKLAKKTKVKS